ncbi:MAG TPA: uroporphyrinogen decarboxylase family protein [Arenicellales bacterium]|jgi:uroporphyrinogen-III decarboxylase|nr:uroporphyrinogen decarboxylase family protein [Pseudomonadales bacterium]MDP6267337.1 uroporphyrinogen decarboxylase family protein [Arenicellales bacterium]MDP7452193.1 uroporphyrinogen decarboxylase family protein [Arenicellales bacterium]HJL51247.1 uroporphyrinogen decarboxylase family protein [Arenicellales bacterium]|tara:strand:- start:1815 stop:2732 length:918 start_codon:yes stop_codon:yes gene_type:complete
MTASPQQLNTKRRFRRLVKRGEVPSHPLLIPLVHAAAAQIDNLDVREFLTDATQMAKSLVAMNQAIGVDAIVCFYDRSAVAEAVGAQLDWRVYPPEISGKPRQPIPQDIASLLDTHDRIQTGVEVLTRLQATQTDETLFAVVITGPATLAGQLMDDNDTSVLETCGRLVSESARIFAEAGAHVIFIVESETTVQGNRAWQLAINPVINVARFYSAIPVLVPNGHEQTHVEAFYREVPTGLLVCNQRGVPDGEPGGVILPLQPREWAVEPTRGFSLITTPGEVPLDSDIPDLRAACQRFRNEFATS